MAQQNRIRFTKLFSAFLQSSQTGGIVLMICTIISLVLANSGLGDGYRSIWHTELGFNLGKISMHFEAIEWINDGLMTIFFLLVGLEIKRELYVGELSNRQSAMLPVLGAVGGMIMPALLYLLINFNNPATIKGAGIPTATDIAFAIAIISLLGNKIPNALKIFLTALAIIDDLGAILVIAIFYGHSFSLINFGLAMGLYSLLLIFNKIGVRSFWIYLPLGIVLWYLMLYSGIHATLSGVLLAFALPFEKGTKESSSYKLEEFLQGPVALGIIPLFALANTAILLNFDLLSRLITAESIGIFAGLVIGKPIGIFFAARIGHKYGFATIPDQVSNKMLWGAGMLGGIGFTMAMFVTNLAFNNKELIELGKISILIASFTAATAGYFMLKYNKSK